jgi:hypothetical protein
LRRKNQVVDAKKEACQKDSSIRGTKEQSREKIPRSGGCCGKKDFRIKRTKEWSREKIPGSGGQCGKKKKNETKKRFQDQAVRIWRHMKRKKDGRLVPCDFLLGRWLLGCSGCPLAGGTGVWWGWVFGRKPGGHQSLNTKKRRMKRTPGSGGQKNGAEKRFQDQAVKRREQRKDSRIRQMKAGKENITRCTLYTSPHIRRRGFESHRCHQVTGWRWSPNGEEGGVERAGVARW